MKKLLSLGLLVTIVNSSIATCHNKKEIKPAKILEKQKSNFKKIKANLKLMLLLRAKMLRELLS